MKLVHSVSLKTAASAVLCAFALFAALPQVSATVADCQTLLSALRTQTQSVTITGHNADKDRSGLVAKIDAASAKLNEGKFADAVQKLNDYIAKVTQIVSAGRMSATDGATLIDGANGAIACINTL